MSEERERVFEGLVRVFMLLLSEQPMMAITIDDKRFREFPFENFSISAVKDDDAETHTFILVHEGDVH